MSDKAAGLITILDGHGGKKEQEFLMCVHCQFMWVPVKGSGRKRGFCLKCNGVTCNTEACVRAGCNGSFEKVFDDSMRAA